MTSSDASAYQTVNEVQAAIVARFDELSPQLKIAARYLVDNPNEVALNPLRQLAASAGVKPSTLVRVANAIGLRSFSQLRAPFRNALRAEPSRLMERARQLESEGDDMGRLLAEMANAIRTSVEETFGSIDAAALTAVAESILDARKVVVTAVGSCYALAHYFHYVARMAMSNIVLAPHQGSLAVDDLMDLRSQDVLIALSFRPYRQETIDAVELARNRGAKVVAISDSRTSPIAIGVDNVFVVPTDAPQFFPSTSGALALLEALLSFIVARGGRKVVRNIEAFDRMRHDLSIWWHQE